jgi:hypothetical protein
VFVYKDLGRGEDAYDPKWISALRGIDCNRDKSDFGRIEKSFQVREPFLVSNNLAEKFQPDIQGRNQPRNETRTELTTLKKEEC